MWFYVQTEPGCFTVGYQDGDKWRTDSDHATREGAAQRVNYLNGGNGFPFALGIPRPWEQQNPTGTWTKEDPNQARGQY
jgi:hypothetical protein